MSELAAQGPGFFGKVRTHGDFVSRRLPVEFLAPWDACMQRGMLFGQQTFGAQWLPVYLNAPIWCFTLGAGICGGSGWVGVLMPGVDRVGRYFPFTIAAPIAQSELEGWLEGAQSWYDMIAQRALSTLAADFVLEQFDAGLNALGAAADATATAMWRLAVVNEVDDAGEAGEANEVNEATADNEPVFARRLADSAAPGFSLWWSEGSPSVPASLRIAPGLPDAQQFAALLEPSCDGWPSSVILRA